MKKLFAFLFFLFCLASLCATENKVALLFLTRGDLNQTDLWKGWINTDLYTIYNHPKNPPSDPWFSQFTIPDHQPNEWGYLLFAQQALLREALKNLENTKFVFLSESCVPLRTCTEIHQILTSDEKSYMRWYGVWWKYRSERTLKEFPREHRWGNHQWIILNRKHAQMIADDDYWLPIAMQHNCCDEAYPATFFSMHGMLDEFHNELTTYVDWVRGRPYLFCESTEENICILLDAKFNSDGPFAPRRCLFARKFSPDFPASIIETIIGDKYSPLHD